ncbi:inosine/xanthosine triphosphatase [Deinococcus aestuarii]|uniref:inosine/xanthosine triphosphatase n=1 Tax=Deinococcus aestuarii TaxID=2774531 RepID=UPI001C0E1FD5|nr:inosine/xanthosine triphosphatase [Deinococcus aestuarii]
MRVRVGSLNPAKVRPVREVFGAWWPDAEVEGVAVPSGVPEQPVGEAQTREGAVNRARAALVGADWGVGLEGGVSFEGEEARLFGFVAVARGHRVEVARTAEVRLPPVVAARVRAGEEVGPVMDGVLGTVDVKRGVGSVGVLSRGLVTRADVWRQAVAFAAVPFLDPGLYPEP